MYRAGVLSSTIPSTLCKVIFERCVLDDLLSRIGELSPVDDVQDEKVLSLAETCLGRGGTSEDLTQAVLAGKIGALRLPSDTAFTLFRVSVSGHGAAGQPGEHVVDGSQQSSCSIR